MTIGVSARSTEPQRSPSALLGRAEDLSALRDRLDAGARLITLIGPAGVGKSSLAAALLTGLDGDTATCDVAATANEDEVVRALARSLSIELGPTLDGRDELARALDGSLLLVDNADRVTDALAALLLELARRAPRAQFVVTSRERLRIDGELAYEVRPLTPEMAVALFEARATAARDDFETDPRLLREIVSALDCIPLAIELAAAQTVVFGSEELRDRLATQLDVLTADRRGVPARHATMRAAVEWSWSLLDPELQHALAALSIFEAEIPLAGAEAIIGRGEAPRVVAALCDRSLLRRRVSLRGTRFGMLRAVRELASEKLDGRETAAEAHADWVLSTASAALSSISEGSAPLNDLAELTYDLRTIATGSEDLERALGAAVALAELAVHRGPARACLELLDACLAHALEGDAEIRSRARHMRAKLLIREGEFEAARTEIETCLLDPPGTRARFEVLLSLADLCRSDEDGESAERAYDEALDLSRSLGDDALEARALTGLGALRHERGDLALAGASYQEALSHHRAANNRVQAGIVLSNLGLISQERGELEAAEERLSEALHVHRETGHERFVGIAEADLAGLCFERGASQLAREHAEVAVQVLAAAGDRAQLAVARALLAATLATLGEIQRAEATLADASQVSVDAPTKETVRTYAAHLHVARALEAASEDRVGVYEAELEGARAALASETNHDAVRLATRILRRAIERAERFEESLRVATDGSWFCAPGRERADLSRRSTLRALLQALVRRRRTAPGEPLSTSELVEAAWGGERILERAAANRLRVALSDLRKLGLADTLSRLPSGYRLAPEVALITQPPARRSGG